MVVVNVDGNAIVSAISKRSSRIGMRARVADDNAEYTDLSVLRVGILSVCNSIQFPYACVSMLRDTLRLITPQCNDRTKGLKLNYSF